MIDNNKNLLIEVSNIALNAGREIMNYYDSNSNVLTKEDKSPLTEADLASNNIIIEKLRLLNNNIPILSEEGIDVDYKIRSDWDQYWLVDPLDGTKEFVKKNDELIKLSDNLQISEDERLLQFSTKSENSLVNFPDGNFYIPTYFFEFIERIDDREGFSEKNANVIFNSTLN